MDALMALAEHQLAQRYRESGLNSFCNPVGQVPDLPSAKPVATPSTPPTHNPGQAVSTKVPRNAACPCGSGVKFKRCCGNPAAPAANSSAGKAA